MKGKREIFFWLFVISLLFVSCSSQKAKTDGAEIISVERVDSIEFEGMPPATVRSGYDLLLIEIETDEEISPLGGDLVVKDSEGNSHNMGGLIDGKYIFEVPETARILTLVIKGTIEIPLP